MIQKITKLITLITVALTPFYFLRFDILGLPTNVFEVAVLCAFLSTFYFLLSTKRLWHFGSIWPYLLLIAAGAGAFFANDLWAALGILKGYFLVPLILYFIILNVFENRLKRKDCHPELAEGSCQNHGILRFAQNDINVIAIPIYISTIFIALWAIFQKLGFITVLFYQKGDASFAQYLEEHIRVFGPFESPNFLAMFLVPMIFLSIPLISIIKDKYLQAAVAISLILPFVALLFSGSRAGMIAFLICAVLAFTIKIKRSFQVSNLLVSALAIMSVLTLVYYFAIIQFNTNSDTVRVEIYRYSIEILKNNWIFGVGLSGFREAIVNATTNAEGFKTFALPYALHPHNIFLAFWLNTGLLGLAIFLINIVIFIYRFLADKTRPPVYLCAFLALSAILVHGMFDTTFFKNDLSAIFFLVLAIGAVYSYEKNHR
jgi:O-antigen ligase